MKPHSPSSSATRAFTAALLGLLAAAALPIFVSGQPPDVERDHTSVDAGVELAPSDAGAADDGGVQERTDGATVQEEVRGFGAETVAVPIFQCRPVREDESGLDDQYPVPRPPFSKEIFPCTRCHDRPDDFNLKKRTLTLEHKEIKLIHGPREQWCYGCHNPSNRDKLRLAGGRLIDFTTSYELCGQCHGPKLRDWRLGIHGRRTGCWNGKREYRLCVHCHNPHAPKFKALKPKRRPRRPDELRFSGQGRR